LPLIGEKPLTNGADQDGSQIYRIFIETRPRNTPVVVRLSIRADGSGEFIAKSSQSAESPDVLVEDRTTAVSRLDVDHFRRLFEDSNFWSLQTIELLDVHKKQVVGDVAWTIEAEKSGSYHVVCRTTTTLGVLRNLVLYLVLHIGNLRLSDISGSAPN
jgi:hypothetical protein